jgi:arsenate reductase (glutaredoxin)
MADAAEQSSAHGGGITIYHNPDCGTSRNTLAMIRAAGYEPKVVLYRDVGWTAELVQELVGKMEGMALRDLIREKGTPARDLGLLDEGVPDATILEAMVAHPILVNRPIVVTPKGVKLCRYVSARPVDRAEPPGASAAQGGVLCS